MSRGGGGGGSRFTLTGALGLAFRRSVLLLSLAVENNFDPFLCLIDLSIHKRHKS